MSDETIHHPGTQQEPQAIEHGPLHLVSAWANDQGLVLGQREVDGKSNEITAVPELLDVLHLDGCIVTLDAMGCQKDDMLPEPCITNVPFCTIVEFS